MLTGAVLVFLVVLCRLAAPLLGTWNFVPMGAVAIYAGARLPRRWAWLVPVSAMILSDLVLDYGSSRSIFVTWRWVSYATFGALALLGPLARSQRLGPWRYPALALAASTLFYLTSNFSVWTSGEMYPLTLDGLLACYYAGIPFFGRTILADLAGMAVLFGLDPVIQKTMQRLELARAARSLAKVDVTESSQGS